jgi:sigma-E factor negative regulatory protein RseA
MTSEQQHWISAAADNHALAASELDALLAQPDLQQTMVRYQLIGAIMRGESGAERTMAAELTSATALAEPSHDFSLQFAVALAQEPVHELRSDDSISQHQVASPASSTATNPDTSSQDIRHSVTVKTSSPGRRWWQAAANHAWLKVGAQGAIAASVALVAVFGINQHNQQPDAALTAPLPVFQTMPVAGTATPVSLNHSSLYPSPASAGYDNSSQSVQQRRLMELLQLRQQQIRLMEQAASQTTPSATPDATSGINNSTGQESTEQR